MYSRFLSLRRALVGLLLLTGVGVVGAPDAAAAADPVVVRVGGEVVITVDAASGLAHSEVQEEFRNLHAGIVEAEYLFPVSRGAVFTNLSLYAGETELRGEMLRSEKANAVYEDIVRRLKDPALVELAGQDLIRTRVFPVQPGETRKIVLRFSQVLERTGDALRLRHPRRVGLMSPRQFPVRTVEPRIDPASGPVVGQPGGSAGSRLVVSVRNADRIAEPFSPTSSIEVSRSGGRLTVESSSAPGGTDFELFLPLVSGEVGATLVTNVEAGEDGHFMLMLRPPSDPDSVRVGRDLTIVLDVSGSMSGLKLVQARTAIGGLLRDLHAGDRFRLITFSSAVRSFRPDLVAATPDSVEAAVRHLEGIPADGGTNIDAALREALSVAAVRERLSVVVFLTDGKPSVGETDPQRLAAMAEASGSGQRVFAFGVGDDVNTFLLDHLADRGRGAVDYVRPGESVDTAVGNLGRRLSAPVLTNLEIVSAPAVLEDLVPMRLPDLYHGEDLIVLGRYRGHGAGDLVIRGRRAGVVQEHRFAVDFEGSPDDEFVTRLWATRKAAALATALRLNGHDPELVEEIRQLGLRYGVLTEFTAYLVQEPELAMNRAAVEDRAERLAAAPTAQAGERAVREADARQKQRQVASLAEAEALRYDVDGSGVAVGGNEAAASRAPRHVGRRLFLFRSGTWVDLNASDGMAEIRLAPHGTAWFELAARRPGLVPALQLGDRVKIAGRGLVLVVEPDGRETLGAADWARVEGAFPADGS